VILVDTSIWIELINGRLGRTLAADRLLEFVTCGPIVQEVLQGVRQASASDPFRDGFLAIPCLSDPLPCSAFLQAADIYRQGRQKGFTIRSSADCLIAAIAIENKVPVWHRDRDFDVIARYTPLHASQQLERLAARLS
jgi:predicted nucleic acid-binding protein